MKASKNSIFLLLLAVIVVTIVVIISVFPLKKIPEGIPNDYYDVIKVLNNEGVHLYLYSDDIDFNGDYEYISVTNFENLVNISASHMNVLVLDMNKNVQEAFATEEQIKQLYEDRFFTIIIVNYAYSGSSQLDNFIDVLDLESDMITFGYNAYGSKNIGSLSGELPTLQILMYSILHEIKITIGENSINP